MKTEISDGRIRLRYYRLEDAPAQVEAAGESVDQVHPWLPWCHPGYSLAEGQQWATACAVSREKGTAHELLVEDCLSVRFLGGCGLNNIDKINRRANLGYWVRTSAAGHGVASTAARLAARFGFEELGLLRIEIVAAVGNRASQRVAEKVGAVREGILRNRLFLHGKPHDAVGYSLVPGDLKP